MGITRNLDRILKQMEEKSYEVRNEFLRNVSQGLVYGAGGEASPVDTGAYVSSHSVTTTRGAGRGRTSHGKPSGVDQAGARASSYATLLGDIEGLPMADTRVYVTNKAPHAQTVEDGRWWSKRGGYYVYTNALREAGNYLAQAVQTVKAK